MTTDMVSAGRDLLTHDPERAPWIPRPFEQVVCDDLAVHLARHEVATVPLADRVLVVPLPPHLVSYRQPFGSPMVPLPESVWNALGIRRAVIRTSSPDAVARPVVPADPAPVVSGPPELEPFGVRFAEVTVVDPAAGPGSSPLLDNVSGTFGPGELVCVVGASKASGRALFQVLSGILPPTSGWVVYGAEHSVGSVTSDRDNSAATPDLGEMTVRDFVAQTALSDLSELSDASGADRLRQRSGELLEQVGLGAFIDSPFAGLSDTQRGIAAVARALLPNGQAVRVRFISDPVRDQPAQIAAAIRQLIAESVQRGDTVIALSDDPTLLRMAARACGVVDGELLEARSS
jgi:ABC-type Mn2+/Zn2+ transport system ATPase subunit